MIVLDRFMKQRIVDKGIADAKVVVVPPWPLSKSFITTRRDARHSANVNHLSQKFVVMYAGNHSPCHPLEQLCLKPRCNWLGASRLPFALSVAGANRKKSAPLRPSMILNNIVCLKYQPLDELAGVLSAADLHAVVMGEEFVGIVHPCKIYNVLAVGSPFLYVGPDESHIADIARIRNDRNSAYLTGPGPNQSVADEIMRCVRQHSQEDSGSVRAENGKGVPEGFSRAALMPLMLDIVERAAPQPAVRATTVSPSSV